MESTIDKLQSQVDALNHSIGQAQAETNVQTNRVCYCLHLHFMIIYHYDNIPFV